MGNFELFCIDFSILSYLRDFRNVLWINRGLKPVFEYLTVLKIGDMVQISL